MATESDQSEKTEDPSLYRLEKSREKGDVPISKEIGTILLLSSCFMVLVFTSVYMYESLEVVINKIFSLKLETVFTKEGIQDLLSFSVVIILKMVAPIFLTSIIIGIISPVFQVGFIFAPELIQFNPDRINPLSGFSRIFSKKSLFEFFKGFLKFTVISAVIYSHLHKTVSSFTGFFHSEIPTLMIFMNNLTIKILISVFLGLLILALIDLGYEKFAYFQRMRMTKKEVKEELKEREGNPEVRSKIKSLQREMAKKRMMKEVPKADVIITNPTHLSIALKYDRKTMVAPLVVAKGADNVALRIREIAREHQVPIVENITVARALYKSVRVGEGIPRDLYMAVAEILGFVYRLRKKNKALSSGRELFETI